MEAFTVDVGVRGIICCPVERAVAFNILAVEQERAWFNLPETSNFNLMTPVFGVDCGR